MLVYTCELELKFSFSIIFIKINLFFESITAFKINLNSSEKSRNAIMKGARYEIEAKSHLYEDECKSTITTKLSNFNRLFEKVITGEV